MSTIPKRENSKAAVLAIAPTTLLKARNESVRQQQLNLHIAKVYLAGTDSGISARTWQNAIDAIVESKVGSPWDHWRRATREAAWATMWLRFQNVVIKGSRMRRRWRGGAR